jgi:hypothetical protein
MKAIKKAKESGSVVQIWSDQNPQGFSYRQYGFEDRRFVDVEGLSLIQRKREASTTEQVANPDENSDPEES